MTATIITTLRPVSLCFVTVAACTGVESEQGQFRFERRLSGEGTQVFRSGEPIAQGSEFCYELEAWSSVADDHWYALGDGDHLRDCYRPRIEGPHHLTSDACILLSEAPARVSLVSDAFDCPMAVGTQHFAADRLDFQVVPDSSWTLGLADVARAYAASDARPTDGSALPEDWGMPLTPPVSLLEGQVPELQLQLRDRSTGGWIAWHDPQVQFTYEARGGTGAVTDDGYEDIVSDIPLRFQGLDDFEGRVNLFERDHPLPDIQTVPPSAIVGMNLWGLSWNVETSARPDLLLATAHDADGQPIVGVRMSWTVDGPLGTQRSEMDSAVFEPWLSKCLPSVTSPTPRRATVHTRGHGHHLERSFEWTQHPPEELADCRSPAEVLAAIEAGDCEATPQQISTLRATATACDLVPEIDNPYPELDTRDDVEEQGCQVAPSPARLASRALGNLLGLR